MCKPFEGTSDGADPTQVLPPVPRDAPPRRKGAAHFSRGKGLDSFRQRAAEEPAWYAGATCLSSPFLPKAWSEDRERCREAKIPDDVIYRPKWRIALEQVARAFANGLTLHWLT